MLIDLMLYLHEVTEITLYWIDWYYLVRMFGADGDRMQNCSETLSSLAHNSSVVES